MQRRTELIYTTLFADAVKHNPGLMFEMNLFINLRRNLICYYPYFGNPIYVKANRGS
jgi:hypothetical protein